MYSLFQVNKLQVSGNSTNKPFLRVVRDLLSLLAYLRHPKTKHKQPRSHSSRKETELICTETGNVVVFLLASRFQYARKCGKNIGILHISLFFFQLAMMPRVQIFQDGKIFQTANCITKRQPETGMKCMYSVLQQWLSDRRNLRSFINSVISTQQTDFNAKKSNYNWEHSPCHKSQKTLPCRP